MKLKSDVTNLARKSIRAVAQLANDLLELMIKKEKQLNEIVNLAQEIKTLNKISTTDSANTSFNSGTSARSNNIYQRSESDSPNLLSRKGKGSTKIINKCTDLRISALKAQFQKNLAAQDNPPISAFLTPESSPTPEKIIQKKEIDSKGGDNLSPPIENQSNIDNTTQIVPWDSILYGNKKGRSLSYTHLHSTLIDTIREEEFVYDWKLKLSKRYSFSEELLALHIFEEDPRKNASFLLDYVVPQIVSKGTFVSRRNSLDLIETADLDSPVDRQKR